MVYPRMDAAGADCALATRVLQFRMGSQGYETKRHLPHFADNSDSIRLSLEWPKRKICISGGKDVVGISAGNYENRGHGLLPSWAIRHQHADALRGGFQSLSSTPG